MFTLPGIEAEWISTLSHVLKKTLSLEQMDNSSLILVCNIRDMGLKISVQMMILG